MQNDKDNNPNRQQETSSTENAGENSKEQFNELSELSLEERMNVADRIGVPVRDVSDAAATGVLSGRDDVAGAPAGKTEENREDQLYAFVE